MTVHQWGVVLFEEAEVQMQALHAQAVQHKENHLILCSHPPLFTVGSDDKNEWSVKTVRCGRGGSITAHSPGQCIFYFVFQTPNPARFYAHVLKAFEAFFSRYLPKVTYDKHRPGFYIDNRKIASLGFRYSQGVSLYGVALNVDVDLNFHAQVPPCGLEGIVPTSLAAEGMNISEEEVFSEIVKNIEEAFNETTSI